MTPMSVGVVVVYYRTPEALRGCIAGLEAQGDALSDAVLVDTGAAESGQLQPPAAVGDVRWLAAPGNIGFGAAANLGAATLQTDAILVMNADVVLAPGAVAALRDMVAERDEIAIVAPRVLDPDGQIELNARSFPTVATGVLGRAGRATAVLRRLGWLPAGLAGAESDVACQVDWVSGACMLVGETDWAMLAGFDEGYWMYWEDADLCRRARTAGRETWFVPHATCRHATGSSGTSPRTLRAFHHSAARYYERHLSRSTADRVLARAALDLRCRIVIRRRAARGV
jgi:N-acetylglucosaminyl-diphospho-decaprenol L-rhamnosyltransferase